MITKTSENFLCSECGSYRMGVTDSRYKNQRTGAPYDHIRRRRRCKDCDHRVTTYETTTKPSNKEPSEAEIIMSRLKAFLTLGS